MKKFIKKIPIIGQITQSVYRKWINPKNLFPGSENYWIERYESGGGSGDGSYGKLAEFKAEFLNKFVREENIKTIIEYGCGDGNQLKLAEYPSYIGFDVSPKIISLCREKFSCDTTKTFRLMNEFKREKAQLTLSLDVIYHLIENNVFKAYMHRLFDSAEEFVIIYSSNTNKNKEDQVVHVKHRKFSEWVEKMKPEWKLRSHIPNKYPFAGDPTTGSCADFYLYEKA